MTVYAYCSPEWLEICLKLYKENSKLKQAMAKVTTRIAFLVKAEPAWGIEKDIIFGAFAEKGEILRLGFFGMEEAQKEVEFIIAATPQVWKKIMRKESKFLTDFMTGKVTLVQGSKVGVLAVAPYAPQFIDAITPVEVKFQDEMTEEELSDYKARLTEFRKRTGI
jgi:hypothetical protein